MNISPEARVPRLRLQRRQIGIKFLTEARSKIHDIAPRTKLYHSEASLGIIGWREIERVSKYSTDLTKKVIEEPRALGQQLIKNGIRISKHTIQVYAVDLHFEPKPNGRAQKICLTVQDKGDRMENERSHYFKVLHELGGLAVDSLDHKPLEPVLTLGDALNEEASDMLLKLVETYIPETVGLHPVGYSIFK